MVILQSLLDGRSLITRQIFSQIYQTEKLPSSAEALKEAKLVGGIKEKCDEDRERIAGEKSVCLAELAKAQPYVDDANKAIDSIKPGDIGEVKVLKKNTQT